MAAAPYDFSKLIDAEGTLLVTVGSHWPASRAFNKPEIEKILRTGTCIACHGAQNPKTSKKKISAMKTETRKGHDTLMETLLKSFKEKQDRPVSSQP
jgi:cytochrome c553